MLSQGKLLGEIIAALSPEPAWERIPGSASSPSEWGKKPTDPCEGEEKELREEQEDAQGGDEGKEELREGI